ncbi:MAG: hypothetical protein IPK82_38330 [Polyangiaceae bacterium]|nr:hypothetical protein [Polyangiaceae bacterium]
MQTPAGVDASPPWVENAAAWVGRRAAVPGVGCAGRVARARSTHFH